MENKYKPKKYLLYEDYGENRIMICEFDCVEELTMEEYLQKFGKIKCWIERMNNDITLENLNTWIIERFKTKAKELVLFYSDNYESKFVVTKNPRF